MLAVNEGLETHSLPWWCISFEFLIAPGRGLPSPLLLQPCSRVVLPLGERGGVVAEEAARPSLLHPPGQS